MKFVKPGYVGKRAAIIICPIIFITTSPVILENLTPHIIINNNALLIFLVIHITLWFILWCIFFTFNIYRKIKIKRLKDEGIRYDGKLETVIRNKSYIRHMSNPSGYAECYYYENNKKHLVRSASFIVEEYMLKDYFSDFSISVYVSRNNPRDYIVELSLSR